MIFSTSADFMRILPQSIPCRANVHKNLLPVIRLLIVKPVHAGNLIALKSKFPEQNRAV